MFERRIIGIERFFHAQQVHFAVDVQALERRERLGWQNHGARFVGGNLGLRALGCNGFFAGSLILDQGLHPALDAIEPRISRHTREPLPVPARAFSYLPARGTGGPSAPRRAPRRNLEYWHPIPAVSLRRPAGDGHSGTAPKR